MSETINECKTQVLNLRIKFLDILSNYEVKKSKVTIQIQDIEDKQKELDNLKSYYKKLRVNVKNTKDVKIRQQTRCNTKEDNKLLKQDIELCNVRLEYCKNIYDDVKNDVDLLKQKLHVNNKDINLNKIIKYDSILKEVDTDFEDIKSCKNSIDKLYDITIGVQKEYKQLLKIHQSRSNLEKDLDKDINKYVLLYKTEREKYDKLKKNNDVIPLVNNYILRDYRSKCRKSLESCNLSYNSLKNDYIKFKTLFKDERRDRLLKRSERVKKLNSALKNLERGIEDMKISIESYPKVTFNTNVTISK